MNKKTRLFVLSLLSFALSPMLQAQTPGEDFTTRIVNPGFEGTFTDLGKGNNTSRNDQPDGWIITSVWSGWRDIGINDSKEAEPSSDGIKYYNIWMGNITSINLGQKITLPIGKYKLTAAMRMSDPKPEYITDQHLFATLSDGVTYRSSVLSEKGIGKITGYEVDADGNPVNDANGNPVPIVDRTTWDTLTVILNVPKEQAVTIGATSTGGKNSPAGWFQIDDFQLIYTGEPGGIDINDIISALEFKIDAANNSNLYSEDKMPRATYFTMIDLASEAGNVGTSTPLEEAQAVLEHLTQAIENADEGKLLFDTLSILNAKATEVPDTYPGYGDFEMIMNQGIETLDAYESTNADFKNVIASLRKAYTDINMAEMEGATAENGKNATWYIENSKFTRPGGNPSVKTDASAAYWKVETSTSGVQDQPWIGSGTGFFGPALSDSINGFYFNSWHYTFGDLSQELVNLKPGSYSLSCDIYTDSDTAFEWIYVNATYENVTKNPVKYEAGKDFWQTTTTDKFYVGKDGKLKIGFYSKAPNGWTYLRANMTNFKLTYYGTEGSADALVEGLIKEAIALRDSVEIKEMIMPVERAELQKAIEEGEAATDKSTVIEVLQTAIADTKECVSLYPSVTTAFEEAEKYLSEGQDRGEAADYEEFLNSITEQTLVLEAPTTSRHTLTSIIESLKNATIRFQYQLTAVATENNPVDITPAIVNATVETSNNKVAPEGWTCSLSSNSDGSYTGNGESFTGVSTDHYLNSYSGTRGALLYTAKQTLIGVPKGTYILKAAGRVDGQGAYLFANSDKLYTQEIDSFGNKGGKIWEEAAIGSPEKNVNGGEGYGWSWITLSGITVDDTRTLEIGITCDPTVSEGKKFTGNWYSVDDFTLFCTKGEGLSAIEDVTTDKDLISSIYVENGYIKVIGSDNFTITTLTGVTVPSNTQVAQGLYIVTVNGQSVKIGVK